jgi:uncharacterized membrane protein (UPF0127 family)
MHSVVLIRRIRIKVAGQVKIYYQGALLWDRITHAATPLARFFGLMGRRQLADGGGMLITPCDQVHGFHMNFPLDILFLNRDMQVLHIFTLIPGRISPKIKGTVHVLEVAAGSATQYGIKPGDYLTLDIDNNKKDGRAK